MRKTSHVEKLSIVWSKARIHPVNETAISAQNIRRKGRLYGTREQGWCVEYNLLLSITYYSITESTIPDVNVRLFRPNIRH